MSGKPYPNGVHELILTLEELATVDQRLCIAIPERDQLATEVESLEEKHRALGMRLAGLLREMDADLPGNYGWEGRFGWLLGEFRRQVLSRAAPGLHEQERDE